MTRPYFAEMEVIDGPFVRYQLIINSVLCCRGVTGLLQRDLCFLADHTHTHIEVSLVNRVSLSLSVFVFLYFCLLSSLTLTFLTLLSPPYLFLYFIRGVFLSRGSNCLLLLLFAPPLLLLRLSPSLLCLFVSITPSSLTLAHSGTCQG